MHRETLSTRCSDVLLFAVVLTVLHATVVVVLGLVSTSM